MKESQSTIFGGMPWSICRVPAAAVTDALVMASLQDLVRHSTASWLARSVKLCLTLARAALTEGQEEGPLPDEDLHLQEVALDLQVRVSASP